MWIGVHPSGILEAIMELSAIPFAAPYLHGNIKKHSHQLNNTRNSIICSTTLLHNTTMLPCYYTWKSNSYYIETSNEASSFFPIIFTDSHLGSPLITFLSITNNLPDMKILMSLDLLIHITSKCEGFLFFFFNSLIRYNNKK